jgi:hypothetical protein
MSMQGGRWSKKSQNLVNLVCERLLSLTAQSEIHILRRLYKPQGNVKKYNSGLYTRSKRPLITNFARCTVHFALKTISARFFWTVSNYQNWGWIFPANRYPAFWNHDLNCTKLLNQCTNSTLGCPCLALFFITFINF